MQRLIVSIEVPGFHCWPNAPESVRFLRDLHRHLFGVRAEVRVTSIDRELEFFLLRRQVRAAISEAGRLQEDGLVFEAKSCEQLAFEVRAYLLAQHLAVVAVEVWEDWENGARVEE